VGHPLVSMDPGKERLVVKHDPDGSVFVRGVRGSAWMHRLGPGSLFYVCKGFFAEEYYQPMVSLAQREMDACHSVVLFVDGWDLKAVDTEFRELWTAWFKHYKQRFHARLLVRTKLMEMAASLANLFTGLPILTTYSDATAWERDCVRDFPDFIRHSRPHPTSKNPA
jgi:hypothetical protein